MALQKSKLHPPEEVIAFANRMKEANKSHNKNESLEEVIGFIEDSENEFKNNEIEKPDDCMCCICPEDIKDNTHNFKKGMAYMVTTDEYGFIHLHENKDDKNGLTFIIKINNQPEMLVLISEKFNLYAFESDKKTTKKYKESIERNLNNFHKYL